MNRQDLPLSGLNLASQALSGNDLILLTQNTPDGLQSVNATLARLLQYLFVDSGAIDDYIGQTFLKQVYTLNPNSGLIGDGRSSNPMAVNFSYLDTLYVNETDFTNYQNNVNTRFDNVNTRINNINNSISQGVVPNSRNVNTGAGLVGGGNLSADRTISMGVPSSITSGSGNSVSGGTHSHELAPGAVTNTKLANNSVTDEKIQSVSASKITGVIPSANLPPAAATINVIDNLTSNSVNDALSANQGRVLAEQLVTNAKLADDAVSTSKIANGAVTNSKIVSVDYSKITNAPTQGVATPVVDNLTSVSTTSALSANQGRVLAEQITSKFNSTGGTITGPTTINSGENSVSLNMDGVLHIGHQLLFRNESTNQTEFNIGTTNTAVVMIAYDRKLVFEAERYDYLDSEGGWFQHTANAGKEKYNFHTDCNVFEFNKDVYFGSVQKAANGYTTLPNGLIMQWGRGQITNDGDVAFPIAFPNSLVNVQVTDEGVGSISHGYNWSLSNNTKFRCTSQGGGALSYSYIALGY